MSFMRVRERLEAACALAGRDPEEVKLVAVTKGRSVARDRGCFTPARTRYSFRREPRAGVGGIRYEALPDAEWHFIGNLQRNKVKYCFRLSIPFTRSTRCGSQTRWRSAARRSRAHLPGHGRGQRGGGRLERGRRTRRCESARRARARLGARRRCRAHDDCALLGRPENARPYFQKLRELNGELGLKELSMGMSGDFEVATEEGATYVRIGSALFEE